MNSERAETPKNDSVRPMGLPLRDGNCISAQPWSHGNQREFCMETHDAKREVQKSISQMVIWRWFTTVESRKSLQIQGNE